jgi:hypothetical protein
MEASDLDRRLAKLDVREGHYKADLELHDRSQSFSSELLKLALGGIVVVGFLLANFPKGPLEYELKDTAIRLLFSTAVMAFALAAGSALLQRFWASSALFHHLQVIKLVLLNDGSLDGEIGKNMEMRTSKFLRAHALLRCTAWFLVAATVLLSAAFTRMLFLS